MTAIPETTGTLGRWNRAPSCWEFFGFDKPTNAHNLRGAYEERIRWGSLWGPSFTRLLDEQYQRCLAELEAES